MTETIAHILQSLTVIMITVWLMKLSRQVADLELGRDTVELAALRARVEAILGTPLEIRERDERDGDRS